MVERRSSSECSSVGVRRHGVSFNPRTQIFLVTSIRDEVAPHELANIWHTDEEFAKAQKETKRTIRAMRKQNSGEPIELDKKGRPLIDGEGSKLCSRGLEHLRSNAHLEQRKINKDFVAEAVFGEQHRQWDEMMQQTNDGGECYGGGRRALDDEKLARAARRASEWARKSARTLGELDERAAWGDRFVKVAGQQRRGCGSPATTNGRGSASMALREQQQAATQMIHKSSALKTAMDLASGALAEVHQIKSPTGSNEQNRRKVATVASGNNKGLPPIPATADGGLRGLLSQARHPSLEFLSSE